MRIAPLLHLVTPLVAVTLLAQESVPVADDPDQIGNRKVDGGINLYSIEEELVLGKQLAQDIVRQARLVDDPIITEYVNRISQNLARNSDSLLPLTVNVIEDDSINAFALPGGYLFVHTGLLENAATEAQLAAAIAHEIGHVAARHGTRQQSRAEVASLATIPLVFAGGWAGFGARQAAQFAIPATLLHFSRAFEEEADNLGLQYMYASGYDPVAYLEFFEKIQALQRTKPNAVSQLFETHPPTGRRIEHSQERIDRNLKPRPEYTVNTSEFDRMRARLRELMNRGRVDAAEAPGAQPDAGPPTLRRRP